MIKKRIRFGWVVIVLGLFLLNFTSEKAIDSNDDSPTGIINPQKLRSYSWYRRGYRNYKPDLQVLDSINRMEPFHITVFCGVWCSDTRLHLPAMMKILSELKSAKTLKNVKIVLVDRGKSCPDCGVYNPADFNIRFVPTFIVTRPGGEELGRIVESPQLTLEKDLLKLLRKR